MSSCLEECRKTVKDPVSEGGGLCETRERDPEICVGDRKSRLYGDDDVRTAEKTSRYSKIKAQCAVSGSH